MLSTSSVAVLAAAQSDSLAWEDEGFSNNLVGEDDEGWESEEPDVAADDENPTQCLFCTETLPTPRTVLEHCQKEHGFDLSKYRKSLALDFYGTIKLINYIRHRIITLQSSSSDVLKDLASNPNKSIIDDEKYLHPVLEDDPLLYAFEDDEDDLQERPIEGLSAEKKVKLLEEQLEKLRGEFAEYQAMVRKSFEQTLKERIEEGGTKEERTRAKVARANGSLTNGDSKEKGKERDDDSHYFSSYAGNEIHETMLKDKVRTEAYRDFIYENKHLFKDKVVLDVGCGTGILSMFCAKAGARKVIAVDNSDIINKAWANVFENGLDKQITLVHGKIEDVVLPVKEVDVIVSEWMGYCLLYEAMLDSVLYARDKYLNPTTGIMAPSHINLAISTLSDSEFVNDRVNFWNEIYGFKMTAMKDKIEEDVMVTGLGSKSLSSTPTTFCHLSLATVTVEELSFIKQFQLTVDGGGDGTPKVTKEGEGMQSRELDRLDGFVIYFDTFFLPHAAPNDPAIVSASSRAETWKYYDAKTGGNGITFTTGPYRQVTHWQQGVLLVNEDNVLDKGLSEGDKVIGTVAYRKSKENSRELEIEMSWEVVRQGGEKDKAMRQLWHMR